MPRKQESAYLTEEDIFAKRLREVMEKRGENQTTLAAKITEQSCVIQRQSISQYMQGQSRPDSKRLTAICKALDVSADYLLGLSEHETPDFDLRRACEFTGLSDDAMEMVLELKPFSSTLSTILSSKEFFFIVVDIVDDIQHAYNDCLESLRELDSIDVDIIDQAPRYLEAAEKFDITTVRFAASLFNSSQGWLDVLDTMFPEKEGFVGRKHDLRELMRGIRDGKH